MHGTMRHTHTHRHDDTHTHRHDDTHCHDDMHDDAHCHDDMHDDAHCMTYTHNQMACKPYDTVTHTTKWHANTINIWLYLYMNGMQHRSQTLVDACSHTTTGDSAAAAARLPGAVCEHRSIPGTGSAMQLDSGGAAWAVFIERSMGAARHGGVVEGKAWRGC